MVAAEARFEGPLPPPQLLAGYEQASAGAAEKIIGMAIREMEHRLAIERRYIELQAEGMRGQFLEARLGQICAFVISLAFLPAGAYVAVHGSSIAGTVLSVAGIAGIVANFLRRPQERAAETGDQPREGQKLPAKKNRRV